LNYLMLTFVGGIGALLLLATTLYVQPAQSVTVATDASTYSVGDTIQVTISNNGPDRITRGGLACDDLWPLALEQLAEDGSWQPVAVPRHQCIGIASALIAPGQTQLRTIALVLDPATYHVVYMFSDVDAGMIDIAVSDPFDVAAPPDSSVSAK
jgi:hypothetical protein